MKRNKIKIGMRPSHPGAFIQTEVLDELRLSVTKAAKILDVRRATLSDLVNEKATLWPGMALRLEKAFQLNMEMLLQMPAWYDAKEMRKQDGKLRCTLWPRIKPHLILHKQFCL